MQCEWDMDYANNVDGHFYPEFLQQDEWKLSMKQQKCVGGLGNFEMMHVNVD